ncbi:MAG: hypothetical protein ACRED5_20075 [Propylenella sp.]
MATQKNAARKSVNKAQKASRKISDPSRTRDQPKGRARKKPGASEGDFYHVEVRPKDEFRTFRTQDVGKPGGIERVAGKRASGSWDTQKWLIGKEHAHRRGDTLVADTKKAEKVLETMGSKPKHVSADRFKAKPRPNVPEREKPTAAQKRARRTNIKKAQAARRKG